MAHRFAFALFEDGNGISGFSNVSRNKATCHSGPGYRHIVCFFHFISLLLLKLSAIYQYARDKSIPAMHLIARRLLFCRVVADLLTCVESPDADD